MRNFRQYDVWIDSMELVNRIYKVVEEFPTNERFTLVSQMTRSAISIPSNIAEGSSRSSEQDFARFLEFSLGSAYELETQVIIAERRKYINQVESLTILDKLISLQKRIGGLRKSIL